MLRCFVVSVTVKGIPLKRDKRSFQKKASLYSSAVVALIVSTASPLFALPEQDVKFIDRIIAAQGKSTKPEFERLAKLVEANPKEPKVRFALGLCFENQGYEQLAADEFKHVCEIQKDHPEAHFKLLTILLAVNDVDGAADEVVACEDLYAKNGKELLKLGQLIQHYGDEELAGDEYEKAVKAQQPQIGAGTALARVRINQSKFNEAIAAADADLVLDRNYGKAHAAKGTALDQLHRSKDATKEFLLAYSVEPYEKGVSTKVAEKLIAEKRFEEAVRPAVISLATSTETLNELDDAKKVLTRLLDKVPDKDSYGIVKEVGLRMKQDPMILYFHTSMGEIYQALGRRERAKEQYEICTTFRGSKIKDQDNPSLISKALIKMGQMEEVQLGNYDQAAVYYKEAEKVYPYNMETKEALARLKSRVAAKENDLAWDIKESLRRLWESVTGTQR